ncbi:primase-like DNA-binding domain-containing protein [Bacillus sp. JJ1474]|uniref:primase-like DNA-binding domain-containing protein n=1 Tax=Bacillus sp. JJ1474 TaxID=3122955 RepID=UPI002FFEF799
MVEFVKCNLSHARLSNIPAIEIYERYLTWCANKDEQPKTKRKFFKSLVEMGFTKTRGGRNQVIFKDVYLLKCKF